MSRPQVSLYSCANMILTVFFLLNSLTFIHGNPIDDFQNFIDDIIHPKTPNDHKETIEIPKFINIPLAIRKVNKRFTNDSSDSVKYPGTLRDLKDLARKMGIPEDESTQPNS